MNNSKAVVVLGKFDGVHIAHTGLISTAVDIAKRQGIKSLVYSMQKSDTPSMTDSPQKLNIIKSLGIDEVVMRELDSKFMMLSAEEFVSGILKEELNACCVVVGENFRFGRNRSAGIEELKEICSVHGIDVVVMGMVRIGDETVSSTFVRKLLSMGNVSLAKVYLGRPFFVKGKVSEGKHLGRKLGFPTVNIYPGTSVYLPANGVYATNVRFMDKDYPAITNVGKNPTVEEGSNIKIETHIFGETAVVYGDEITVEFLEFIRPEVHFADMDELTKQVEEDKLKAKKIHNI